MKWSKRLSANTLWSNLNVDEWISFAKKRIKDKRDIQPKTDKIKLEKNEFLLFYAITLSVAETECAHMEKIECIKYYFILTNAMHFMVADLVRLMVLMKPNLCNIYCAKFFFVFSEKRNTFNVCLCWSQNILYIV